MILNHNIDYGHNTLVSRGIQLSLQLHGYY
jgi:hypothetical protein